MKSGSRTLGIAFSDGAERSRIGGAVVRGDRVTDGLVFGTCSVGGLDATERLIDLFDRLGREDVQRVMTAGIAPAWFNLIDLARLEAAIDRPVIAVSFEESDGLESVLRREFDGDALSGRMAVYDQLPERNRIHVTDQELFVRSIGITREETFRVVKSHLNDGRLEPLRVARIAARAHRDIT